MNQYCGLVALCGRAGAHDVIQLHYPLPLFLLIKIYKLFLLASIWRFHFNIPICGEEIKIFPEFRPAKWVYQKCNLVYWFIAKGNDCYWLLIWLSHRHQVIYIYAKLCSKAKNNILRGPCEEASAANFLKFYPQARRAIINTHLHCQKKCKQLRGICKILNSNIIFDM
jgi:hypothetical protein